MTNNQIFVGRRKASVARVRMIKGKGSIIINDKEPLEYKFEKIPKKLKVGFVSGDLGNHSVGYFLFDLIKILQTKKIRDICIF